MSLLSGLLDHMPPTAAGADKPTMATRPTDRVRLMLVERPAPFATSPHASAATATPEWRRARDQYLNHIMVCHSCYAPTGRHCTAGTDLRTRYDSTPMEDRP